MPTEDERREAAIKRLKEKRAFSEHLVAYVVVNAFLVLIWFMTDTDYFWPIWPIAGWGIGLVMHAWTVYGTGGRITEADIQREMRRGGDTLA